MDCFRNMLLWLVLMTASALAAPTPISSPPTAEITSTIYHTKLGLVSIAKEPIGRGTFSIFFSCTATFVFCVWTSVHPNIIPGASTWYRTYYKIMYMLAALIVPEGVIMCAYGQWHVANLLLKAWRKQFKPEPISWPARLMFWKSSDDWFGIDVAFFVVMGGFVVDIPGIPLVEGAPPTFTTLTPRGFLKYMNEGYIHHETFNRRSIADKGKTSNIAKLLASFQTLWLLAQCLSRWINNLPLTLLEIHVSIQVLCTIIITALWWSKPLNVNEPIKIRLQKLTTDPSTDSITPAHDPWELVPEEKKTDFALLEEHVGEGNFFTISTPGSLTSVRAKAYHDMMEHVIHSRDEQFDLENMGGLPLFAEGMLILSIGALHAGAWRSHFPSDVERWLWQGSSIAMCVFPGALGIILSQTEYQHDLLVVLWKRQFSKSGFWDWAVDAIKAIRGICVRHSREHESTLWFYFHCLLILVCLLFILCYAFSVMFITVEAYISLRDLPKGSFLTPRWTDFWPHL